MLKRFGNLFSESLNEYGEKFKPIFKCFLYLSLIPTIIFLVLSLIIMLVFIGSASLTGNSIAETNMFNLASLPLGMYSDVIIPSGILFPLFLVGLIFIVLVILLHICYLYIAFFGKKEMSFKKIFNGAKGYFWGYIGLSLSLIIFLILLFILFIIPGIIFLVYWIFAIFIFMREKTSAWESMKRSKAIIKGKWWRTFGFILLISLIAGIASIIAGIIPLIGSFITTLAITPFTFIFFKNMYLNMRSKAGKK